MSEQNLDQDGGIANTEVSPATITNLSSGILHSCEAELTSVSKELKDFTDQQDALIEKMSQYNIKTDTSHVYLQLKDAMDLISSQMERLTAVRQDMTAFQERSQRLRVRAEKLRSRIEDKERRDENLVAQLVGSGEHNKESDRGQTQSSGPIVGVETKVELGL